MVRALRWPLSVQKDLKKIYDYILQTSFQNAQKVKSALLFSTKKLADQPEIHPPDKYKKNNKGNFRAYELHRYRVSYHVADKQITMTRIRHTKMNPKEY